MGSVLSIRAFLAFLLFHISVGGDGNERMVSTVPPSSQFLQRAREPARAFSTGGAHGLPTRNRRQEGDVGAPFRSHLRREEVGDDSKGGVGGGGGYDEEESYVADVFGGNKRRDQGQAAEAGEGAAGDYKKPRLQESPPRIPRLPCVH